MFINNEQAIIVNIIGNKVKKIEKEILTYALKKLEDNIPKDTKIETKKLEENRLLEKDGLLSIRYKKKNYTYYFEIKPNLTASEIGLILLNKESIQHELLIISRYVSNYLADQLIKNKIQFLDSAGNMYIDAPPIYIFIKGNRPPDFIKETSPKRILNLQA